MTETKVDSTVKTQKSQAIKDAANFEKANLNSVKSLDENEKILANAKVQYAIEKKGTELKADLKTPPSVKDSTESNLDNAKLQYVLEHGGVDEAKSNLKKVPSIKDSSETLLDNAKVHYAIDHGAAEKVKSTLNKVEPKTS
ncbi:MAG: hypothetical protein MHPSP_002779 [Paramarteilia canceri]